jgi:CYTH domain-containing protein
VEIERKFVLLKRPPRELLGEGTPIWQGYVRACAGLRLRRLGERYFVTLKGEGTLVREEWETEVPAWVFERLWPATEGARLEKTRYRVPYEGRVLEVDEYHGPLAGFWSLECEFPTEEAAGGFAPPAWAAVLEVTEDPAYLNSNLAMRGLPVGAPRAG